MMMNTDQLSWPADTCYNLNQPEVSMNQPKHTINRPELTTMKQPSWVRLLLFPLHLFLDYINQSSFSNLTHTVIDLKMVKLSQNMLTTPL